MRIGLLVLIVYFVLEMAILGLARGPDPLKFAASGIGHEHPGPFV